MALYRLSSPPVFGLGLSNKPNNNTRPKKTQPSLTPEQAIALANEQLSRPSMKTGTASSETTMGKRKRHPPPLLGLVLGYSLYTYRGSAPVFASLLLTVIVLLYALIHVADDNRAHETAHNRSTASSNTGSSGISSSSAKYLGFKQQIMGAKKSIMPKIPYAVNGDIRPDENVNHVFNIFVKGISTYALQTNLDLAGIAVSGGSACTAGSLEPSHVLTAMFGADSPRLGESIRLSFGAQTTKADIQAFIDALLPIVQRLQAKQSAR